MAFLPGITLLSLIITKKEIFLFHRGRGFHFPSIPSSTYYNKGDHLFIPSTTPCDRIGGSHHK
jgi:hypothetical protein